MLVPGCKSIYIYIYTSYQCFKLRYSTCFISTGHLLGKAYYIADNVMLQRTTIANTVPILSSFYIPWDQLLSTPASPSRY